MNAPPDSPTNAHEFSVSEISNALKRTVEDAFGNVRVRGEISGYRGPHSSGHAYFALKDDKARIDAVIWRTSFIRLKFKPEEGMEVIATGRLTTYPGKSNYQIVIENLEPAGAGALMALLEERKRRLAAEGLFDAGRKRPLPYMPCVIGVVTSPTGAVIRDIIHRIADRFPLHVIVWPVRVQGETAGAEAAAAVAGFNALSPNGPVPRPDVLIVARGGGSLEDLWGFNDEALARTVAASGIPVISAVGHETDWTLIDLAADRRAPTPTGAAEMAVPVKAELEATLASLGARLRACTARGFDRRRQALRAAARALPSPDQLFALPRRRFDESAGRLGRALEAATGRKRARLDTARLQPSALSRRTSEARQRLTREGEQLPKCAKAFLRARRGELREVGARLRIEPIARHLRADMQRLDALSQRGETAFINRTERARARLTRAAAGVRIEPIAAHLRADTRRLEALSLRSATAFVNRVERATARLAQATRLVDSLSYQSVLERGYAVVRDADGKLVHRAAEVSVRASLDIEFADGKVATLATGGEHASRPKPARRRQPESKQPGAQGSLF